MNLKIKEKKTSNLSANHSTLETSLSKRVNPKSPAYILIFRNEKTSRDQRLMTFPSLLSPRPMRSLKQHRPTSL